MVGRRKLADPWLNRILMLYGLVCNIRSHLNQLILASSAYKGQAERRSKPSSNDYNLVRKLVTVTTG